MLLLRRDYTAFGIELQSSGPSNPFRYCGEYYDTELDSVYLRNRYYNPATGRFLTEDPVKDGMNWYSYCAHDPINLFDPDGLKNTGDFTNIYKQIMNILICQSRWPSANKKYRIQLNIWAGQARYAVKEHVNKYFNGDGFAELVNEVINDTANKTME